MVLLAALLVSTLLLPPVPLRRISPRHTVGSVRMDVETGADWATAAANLARAPPPAEAMDCDLHPLDFCDLTSTKVVLLRHGESEWNAGKPRFTGWHDVHLSEAGITQAMEAGQILLEHGHCVEHVFVSNLKRTIKTAWVLLEAMDSYTVPVTQSWRLNERMYGALTGLDKKETERMLGKEGFEQLRRDPPPIASDSCFNPSRNPAFRSVPQASLPKKESFEDTRERVVPFWEDDLLPRMQAGQSLMVISSKNLLRSLLMAITDLPEQELVHLDIPNCQPLVYDPASRTLQLLLPGGESEAWPSQAQRECEALEGGLGDRLSRFFAEPSEGSEAGQSPR